VATSFPSKDEKEPRRRETSVEALRREDPRGQKAQESTSPRPGVSSWGADEGDGSEVERKSLRRRSQAGRFDWEARERTRGRKLLLDLPLGEKL